jgi:DNA-binding winged helix-turn-helix (wHTH) protein
VATYHGADTVYAGELEIRVHEGLVLASGRPLMLSVREFELLAAMARRIGAIITREELYSTVWGHELRAGDRSVDVYVSKLRSKLEAVLPDRRFIHTHQGFGYRFQPEAARGAASGEQAAGEQAADDTSGDESPSSADVGAMSAEWEAVHNGQQPSRVTELSRDVHIGVSDA